MNLHLLGQVMIDKNPGITSAVNKTSNIDNTYRNFQMEVLSGEENMLTKVPCRITNPEWTDHWCSESRQRMFMCKAAQLVCSRAWKRTPLNPAIVVVEQSISAEPLALCSAGIAHGQWQKHCGTVCTKSCLRHPPAGLCLGSRRSGCGGVDT